MIKRTQDKFNKPVYILYPGEFFATHEDCVMETVTGLCVAVCLFDNDRGIGGMGHFIVPGKIEGAYIINNDIAARGITSMEYLIGEIVKQGGDRKKLHAKIFGAGYGVADFSSTTELSQSNIYFIHEYFSMERITIDRIDLGGDFRRRIFFFARDGMVYRKILENNEDESEFLKMEKEYIATEHEQISKAGGIVLFK